MKQFKDIGKRIVSPGNWMDGCIIIAFMWHKPDGTGYYLVESQKEPPGAYADHDKYWSFYPSHLDYKTLRLDEIYSGNVGISFSLEEVKRQPSKDIYAAGPEGETKGYLEGCTGLRFL